MAPEVLKSAVEPASDIWSAGVMAHQLLTGRFPFDDKRSPGNPTISKIWWALLPCLKLMDFCVTSKAVTLSRQGLLIRAIDPRPDCIPVAFGNTSPVAHVHLTSKL